MVSGIAENFKMTLVLKKRTLSLWTSKWSGAQCFINTISSFFVYFEWSRKTVTRNPILAASSCTYMRICAHVGTPLVAKYILEVGLQHSSVKGYVTTHDFPNTFNNTSFSRIDVSWIGAQWLGGRVLDLRSRGCEFELHKRHCIVYFSKILYLILNTGSDQEDLSEYDWTIVDWDVKNQNNTNTTIF